MPLMRACRLLTITQVSEHVLGPCETAEDGGENGNSGSRDEGFLPGVAKAGGDLQLRGGGGAAGHMPELTSVQYMGHVCKRQSAGVSRECLRHSDCKVGLTPSACKVSPNEDG